MMEPRHRHDGWTEARRALFLDRFAADLDVKAAAAAAGMSRESAYRLRARDPVFAARWAEPIARRAADRAAQREAFRARAGDGPWIPTHARASRSTFDRWLMRRLARLEVRDFSILADDEAATTPAIIAPVVPEP